MSRKNPTASNPTVPVDLDVAEELIGHIRSKTTDMAESQLHVPATHFTSPSRAEAEIRLMKRLPLAVAHVSEIKEPGDFITRDVLGAGVIITRQKDGSIVTFQNNCRHRGGVVETEGSGNKRAFVCKYHGWSYSSEGGKLNPLPYESTYGPVDHACNGLARIKTEIRYGLIFLTFESAPDQQPIGDYMGAGVDAQIDPWGLDGAVLFMEHVLTQPMNWKLVMDGAIDALHAPFLHPLPGGVGDRTVPVSSVFRNYGRHGKMFMARKKILPLIEAGDTAATSSKHVGSVLQLYPNAIYVSAPEHVEFWTVWPTVGNPSECTIRIRFFVRPEILTPEMEARVHKSWEILGFAGLNEDFPMEVAIQKNALAYPDSVFQYGLNEKPTQNLHRQLIADLGP